ncbi:MAG TPA: TerC family protein [Bacteroidales bacterium]|jgi:tellurite resistance protein TerC|nr:TerC family protein [Bacteroidales bacterium]
MEVNTFFWIGFHVLVFSVLALDLGVFNKNAHKISLKEALIWSAVWILLALAFNVFVLFEFGKTKALEFFTGYVIEYSLSVDNIFVFILIFTYFSVKPQYQHKILFWGILGALVMRGIFIFTGVALINKFHWIVLIFGAFLVFTGLKMLFQKESSASVSPEKNPLVRVLRKFMPVTEELHGDSLFVRQNRKLYATPLFLVLLVVESSDLIFAVDSIPAILAISQDTFIVYTSNIFAILGLRSLYFAVSGIMGYFRFLKVGLALVLSFVGLKMLAAYFHFEIPIVISLLVIVSILVITILASLIIKEK